MMKYKYLFWAIYASVVLCSCGSDIVEDVFCEKSENNIEETIVTGRSYVKQDQTVTTVTVEYYLNVNKNVSLPTECGVICSTEETPSIEKCDKKVTLTKEINRTVNRYVSVFNNLHPTKKYYYRAYACIDNKYIYGEVKTFVVTHEYIDLGLPSKTLWAKCNIGADKPEDFGEYFAWGEITCGYGDTIIWNNYKWYDCTSNSMKKYCTDNIIGKVDNLTELYLEDDAAYVCWGDNWRIPSSTQLQELINSSYTKSTFMSQDGVYGLVITSKSNGNSIFLPAAGYRYGSELIAEQTLGCYWSRSLNTSYSYDAYLLSFQANEIEKHSSSRCRGLSIRPVYIKK